MIARFLSGFLVFTVSAVAAPPMDEGDTNNKQVSFDTGAVVQFFPGLQNDIGCTAFQIEPQILMTAGHCAKEINSADDNPKSVKIPIWRKDELFKTATRYIESGNAHDIGLVLVQSKYCKDVQPNETQTLNILGPKDKAPQSTHVETASFGSSDIKYWEHDGESLKYDAKTRSNVLQTGQCELFKFGDPKRKAFEAIVKNSLDAGAMALDSERTIEIDDSDIRKESVVKKKKNLFLYGDSGTPLSQKDKYGKSVVTGVMSQLKFDRVEKAKATLYRDGKPLITLPINTHDGAWADPSARTADFKEVQKAFRAKGLKMRATDTFKRSYNVKGVNYASPLADPQNQKFIQQSLEELRGLRDKNFGCEPKPPFLDDSRKKMNEILKRDSIRANSQ